MKRLILWMVLLTTWEAAYRLVGWKSYIFPAPSHVADGTLSMLRIETALGDPVSRAGWPWPAKSASAAFLEGRDARLAGREKMDNPYAEGSSSPSPLVAQVEYWRRGHETATSLAPKYRAVRKTIESLLPFAAHPADDFLRLPKAIPNPIKPDAATSAGYADALAGVPMTSNPYIQQIANAEGDWRRGFDGANNHWYNSPLVEAVLTSVARLIIGFVLSLLVGVIIGALAWRFKPIDEFIGPLLLGVQTLPSVCWVPLAVILFGINETSVLFVLMMGSFSAVAIALRDGLRAIPPLYQQAGRMMGARRFNLYWYVLLPASLPALATSLRQGFSFAWRSLMGAELLLVVYYHGLGHLLSVGRDMNAVEQVVAVLIIMILIGILADRWVFAPLQQRINRRFGLVLAGG